MLENEEQSDSSDSDSIQHSVSETSQKKKKRKKNIITANLSATRYKLVHKVVEDLNFHIINDDTVPSYLIWNDTYVSNEKVAELECYQRINHFPGMAKITRKDCLARNFQKMQKVNSEEFNFHPLTWIMPSDFSAFSNHVKNQKGKKEQHFFIIKPSNGAQGNGIYLCKYLEKSVLGEHSIVQEYIDKPLLIDGFKFDLRLYVLITSCDPLRIFVFKEGLVRLSTEQYFPPNDQNLNNLFMHLTNYSINKRHEYYEKGMTPDSGNKRSIKYLNKYLRSNEYNVSKLWQQIYDLIIKTMILVEPHLLHAYRNCRPGALPGSPSVCFEILGFDVIIDQKLKPWLLEVNRSPSLGTDQKIDLEVKSSLLEDALHLLHIKASDKKKNRAVQKAQSQKRLLRGIQKINKSASKGTDPGKNDSMKRKEELLNLLDKFRRNAAQEAFENENCGQFYRIFPSDDKLRQQKYTTWMTYAFLIFQSDVKISVPKDIDNIYNHTLQEDDILNLLAEYEDDESSDSSSKKRNPTQRLFNPYIQHIFSSHDIEEEEISEEEQKLKATLISKRGFFTGGPMQRNNYRKVGTKNDKLLQRKPTKSITPNPAKPDLLNARSLSESRIMTTSHHIKMSSTSFTEEELTKKALQSLNGFQIKYPDKNDSEVEQLLSKIYENWKLYKSNIASYWLIKLDSVKRKQIIDIVKSNVCILFQKIWKIHNIEQTKLYHLLQKVFNRLLWSHGQGLWNCFFLPGNSWEVILNKSTEAVSETELECCRRVVKLCQDCLLIVYQLANDSKQEPADCYQNQYHSPTFKGESYNPLFSGHKLQPPLLHSKQNPTSNSAGDVSKGEAQKTKISKTNPRSSVNTSLNSYTLKKS